MVSTKTLYKYIDLGLLKITNLDSLIKVRRNTRKATSRANRRILGTSIEKRPEHINDRSEFGHWEMDTVIGIKPKEEPLLLTLTERKTRFEIIINISGKTEKAVSEAIQDLVNNESSEKLFKSITSDDGTEFTSLSEAVSAVADVYLTHPYLSYEQGTNENQNGIIRRFIPKGVLISSIEEKQIRFRNNWMNDYPRRLLGYITPLESHMMHLMA